jgi:YesN/AraC family two-component response regulator
MGSEKNSQTVLIVDDFDGVRKELCILFEDEGYIVEQAENGKIALDLMNQKNFDLVITDILMPEVDGIELIIAIIQKFPKTKTIAITGGGQFNELGSQENLLEAVENLGAEGILKKPFKSHEILELAEKLLANIGTQQNPS